MVNKSIHFVALLTPLFLSVPPSARAQNLDEAIDGMTFWAGATLTPPGEATLSADQSMVSGSAGPWPSGFQLAYGAYIPSRRATILVHSGYERWQFDFAPNQRVGSDAPLVRATASAIPIGIGGDIAFGPKAYGGFVQGSVGLLVASGEYPNTDGQAPASADGKKFFAQASAGGFFNLSDGLSVRAFVQGRMAQDLKFSYSPDIPLGRLALGLSLCYHTHQSAWPEPKDGGPLSGDQGPRRGEAPGEVSKTTTQAIQKADALKAKNQCVEAAELYAQAVRSLPRNKRMRKNLEVPLRIDWADCLNRIGRIDDAARVLQEAYRIDPENPQVQGAMTKMGIEPQERLRFRP